MKNLFCEAAARAMRELAACGLSTDVTLHMHSGVVRGLEARVLLVTDGEQRLHVVPSQSWRRR